jgi:DedD protein
VAQAQDEGFHEIQLNGKQLVFLFMATTVVSVVIFLLGVLVGRGVRAERAAADNAAQTVAETPQAPPPSTPVTPAADPTAAEAPAPASEKLSYFDLEKKTPPSEALKPAAGQAAAPRTERQTPTPPVASPPAAAPTSGASSPAAAPPPPAASNEAPRPAAEPNGAGYAVQIAALNVRSEADAIARRLSSKGYSAYVLAPPSGSPSVFRVRVGKFPTRREAESVAARLQKEEQFKPWVTR